MGRIDRPGRVAVLRSCRCSTRTPPFKTVGTGGIRPGRLPRWLKLLTKLAAILDLDYLRSSDQENNCADIGISAPSAKLIWDSNCFLSLRPFGEICRKPQHCLYKKTLLTLIKLIYPPIIPVNINVAGHLMHGLISCTAPNPTKKYHF